MGLIYWIVVGLIAGWLAGKVMKGGGYGVLVDIVLGILGGIFGGWLFGMLGIWPGGGIIGSIIVAFVGAVLLVWITRLLKNHLVEKEQSRARTHKHFRRQDHGKMSQGLRVWRPRWPQGPGGR